MAMAKISIVLEYDLDNHFESLGYKDLKPETIIDDLEDNVYEDLLDLMRNDRLRFWAYYEIVDAK
jgi:hypothetical protein